MGLPSEVTVVAVDATGHRIVNYIGTIHFTSSDPSAILPADYTFTAADMGMHTFMVTFKTAGKQTVTATDTANATLTGTGRVGVEAPDDNDVAKVLYYGNHGGSRHRGR